MRSLNHHIEIWPYKTVFRISREARTQSRLIRVEISENGIVGRGECCPYPRFGETIESVNAEIIKLKQALEDSKNLDVFVQNLPKGAARNGIECAMLDLWSKQRHQSVAKMLALKPPQQGETAQTIVIDSPQKMHQSALACAGYPLLKVKLDGTQIIERVRAIKTAAPMAKIIIDANEAWHVEQLKALDPELAKLGVCLIEQPIKACDDHLLEGYMGQVPLCADESSFSARDLATLRKSYSFLNIKLDKTGGLRQAITDIYEAKALGFGIMVGCMVGTSLAMAPAAQLAGLADYMDIDGPLFLKNDRDHPLIYNKGVYQLPKTGLWGEGLV